MALSDACFEFLVDFGKLSKELAIRAHHYAAPDYPVQYGSDVERLRRAAKLAAENPYDGKAAARVVREAITVLKLLDTTPKPTKLRGKELIEALERSLGPEEAESVPDIVENVVTETRFTEKAAARLKELLPKLGKPTYEVVIKVIGDVASATAKKILGM